MQNKIGLKGASVAAILAGSAIGAAVFGPTLVQTADAKPIVVEAPGGAPLSFADLIDRVSPAVVSVNVISEREISGLSSREQFLERFRGVPGFGDIFPETPESENDGEESDEPRTREARSLGSGFFISGDGFVVTNNHVVENAVRIELVLSDGEEVEATLVGTDPRTDLAVLKVSAPDRTFPYVEFANSADMRVGDWVVALGNPFGLGGTATAGIISADGRQVGNDSPYTDFLQIDASINRGNSGGPTFDLNGRVIGVNTAIFSPTGGSVGIGFAIPADLAVGITEQLVQTGRVSRGWLGVSIQDLSDEFSNALGLENVEGAIVSDINPQSPALKAGVQRWDVIVEVNGTSISNAKDLTRVVADLLAGSTNQFVVLREGSRRAIDVTVGEQPADLRAERADLSDAPAPEEENQRGPLGLSLQELDDATRSGLGLKPGEKGLLITGIAEDSPLIQSGVARLRPGWVILDVNGRAVDTVEAFAEAIEAARSAGREQALMAVRAGRATLFVPADITGDG